MARVLTPQAEDFPRWYQDVVAKAELAETGPVRGTQVIRPTGYAIWERIQAEVDARIKAAGALNCSFVKCDHVVDVRRGTVELVGLISLAVM